MSAHLPLRKRNGALQQGVRSKTAERAVKSQSSKIPFPLIADASHQHFRNAETLLGNGEQIKTEQKNAIYQDIYDDSMWLINLVENLLSVTRIENGSMELNLQGEIMEDVIMEALRHVNRRGKKQEIEVDCDEFLMVR